MSLSAWSASSATYCSAQARVGQTLEIGPYDYCLDKFRIVLSIVENRGSSLDTGLDVDKSGATQRGSGALGILVEPGRWETLPGRVRTLETPQVSPSSR